MAPQLSEQEQLAQVRRMIKQRPYTPPTIVAEGALRTPIITRFIRTKAKKLEAARGDALSIITTSNTSVIKVRRLWEAKVKLTAKKKHIATSRRIDDKEEAIENNARNVALTHTSFASGLGIKRFPQVKARRDIYELPEDDSSILIATSVLQASLGRHHKQTPTKELQSESLTSSFRYPETPLTPQREENQTLEECLNVARKASQIVHKEASNMQTQHPVGGAFISKMGERVTARAQEIPQEPQQEEQLTELDLEIIHLGEDSHDFISTISPNGSGRAGTAVQHEHDEDVAQVAKDADGESDVHSEEPPEKRRRSNRQIPHIEARTVALQQLNSRRRSRAYGKSAGNKSKTSKMYGKLRKTRKKRRTLPVSELVTVTERPGHSDIEMTGSTQAELSQDPISQQADESDSHGSDGEHYKPDLRLKINLRPRNRFGAIDISLFRTPEHPGPAAMRSGHTISSYSNGFEGKEAAPIGVYMPVKYPARHRESYQKITIRLGKLTLVSKRPSEEREVEPQDHPRKLQRRKVNATRDTRVESGTVPGYQGYREPLAQRPVPNHSLLDIATVDYDEDQMLMDTPNDEIAPDVRVDEEHQRPPKTGLKEQNTPRVPSINATSETPEHLISPLKRKQSAVHDDMIKFESLLRSQKSASQRVQEHLAGMGDEARISQQLAATPLIKEKAPVRARTESLEVANELMMVSMQKRPRESKYDTDSSEEEEDSDRESAESYSEPENGLVAGVIADNTNSNNLLQNTVLDGIQVAPESAGMSDNPEVHRPAGIEKALPCVNLGRQDTLGENIRELSETIQQMASQELEIELSTELRTRSQTELAFPDNGGREISDDSTTLGRQHQSHRVQPDDDSEPSWQPRVPDKSGPAMEVDEEIIDSPPTSNFAGS